MDHWRAAEAVRIVIAAPFPGVVELHQRLVDDPTQVQVCAAVHEAGEALDQVRRLRPDVLVISEELTGDPQQLRLSLAEASVQTRLLVLGGPNGSETTVGAGRHRGVDSGTALLLAEIVRVAEEEDPPAEAPAAHSRQVARDPATPGEDNDDGWRERSGPLGDASAQDPPVADGVASDQRADGRIVLLFSGKGGVGKSVLATNLAVMLAQRGRSAVIVDLSLQYGDVGVLLRLEAHPVSIDSLTGTEPLSAERLEEALATGPEGARAVLAPTHPGGAATVTPAGIRALLVQLRQQHEFVVVDTAAHVDDALQAALLIADTVLLVSSFSITSVKDTKLTLRLLEALGIDRDRVALVLNQTRPKSTLARGDIERSLGMEAVTDLPHDPAMDEAVDAGSVLAMSDPRSDFVREMSVIAERVADLPALPEGAEVNHRRRLLRRR